MDKKGIAARRKAGRSLQTARTALQKAAFRYANAMNGHIDKFEIEAARKTCSSAWDDLQLAAAIYTRARERWERVNEEWPLAVDKRYRCGSISHVSGATCELRRGHEGCCHGRNEGTGRKTKWIATTYSKSPCKDPECSGI